MNITVSITRVDFSEVTPMFESELKLYFDVDGAEHYVLMPGSQKELCKLFNLSSSGNDDCDFAAIKGKQCVVNQKGESYTFVDSAN